MSRVIKKYANRRLYDTTASSHVTLDGIRELVVAGEDVVVIDDTSGDDITRSVMLQIITEQEQGGRPILSADMLKYIIRFYGNPMQDFMARYLEQSLETFMNQQRTLQEQFDKAMSAAPLDAMQNMTKQNLETWTKLQQSFMDSMTPGKKK